MVQEPGQQFLKDKEWSQLNLKTHVFYTSWSLFCFYDHIKVGNGNTFTRDSAVFSTPEFRYTGLKLVIKQEKTCFFNKWSLKPL